MSYKHGYNTDYEHMSGTCISESLLTNAQQRKSFLEPLPYAYSYWRRWRQYRRALPLPQGVEALWRGNLIFVIQNIYQKSLISGHWRDRMTLEAMSTRNLEIGPLGRGSLQTDS